MKKKHYIKSFLIAIALTLGIAANTAAQAEARTDEERGNNA